MPQMTDCTYSPQKNTHNTTQVFTDNGGRLYAERHKYLPMSVENAVSLTTYSVGHEMSSVLAYNTGGNALRSLKRA